MPGKDKTLENKASTKNGILRMVFVVIAILLEAAILVAMFVTRVGDYAEVIALLSRIVAVFLVVERLPTFRLRTLHLADDALALAEERFASVGRETVIVRCQDEVDIVGRYGNEFVVQAELVELERLSLGIVER